MSHTIVRRDLLGLTGAAIMAAALGAKATGEATTPKRKIIAVCCSPRKGKTTAAALQLCLDAAKEQNPALETELLELADLSIPAQLAAGVPLKAGETDDFPAVAGKLADPAVGGIIVGSPVYFGNMSALCKAFLDRCISLRKDGFKLHNKFAGALAVGGTRNGGQELTVQAIHNGLMGQDVILVGSGQPSVRIGATLWNQEDSIDADTFGADTAKDLGRRMAGLLSPATQR